MNAAKTRFQKVSLKELKKILPDQVLDGNKNHRGHQKDKRKGKEQAGKTSSRKSKA
jgi:hypothetical protein